MKTPTNLFIFVTNSGSVFDRTDGKNIRLFPGKRYATGKGSIEIVKEGTKTFIQRFSEDNNLGYRKEITTSGMYIVTPLFVQAMPKTCKEVRILYNKLKTIFNKPAFKIIERKELITKFKIRLRVRLDRGVADAKFDVLVNPEHFTTVDIEEIYMTLEKASKANFPFVLKYYNVAAQEEFTTFINKDFFDHIEMLQRMFPDDRIAN